MDKFLTTVLIFIVIAGVLIYALSRLPDISNFLKSQRGKFGFPSFSLGTSTAGYSFTVPPWNPRLSGGGGYYQSPLSYTSGQLYYSTAIPSYLIPAGFTRDQISPYFEQVKIGGVSSYYSFGYQTQLQLYSRLPAGESVNLTGWHVKSNRGDIVVPQAVNFYNWTGLVPDTDIIVPSGGVVSIYGNTSPIGKNLRLNKCTGYLQRSHNFNPAIPQNCPSSYNRQDIVHFSGFCQNYILSLGACQLPDTRIYNLLPPTNEGNDCRNFLNTITVKSCYDKYSTDRDFLSNAWLVWINQTSPVLDPYHDQLNLFDKNGLLVDQYTY